MTTLVKFLPDAEVKQGALDYVNAWRTKYGVEPLDALPKGVRGSSSNCPLAIAAKPVRERTSDTDYATHNLVVEFITRFDRGDYPELVIDDDDQA